MDRNVTGAYTSDLLSDVIANSREGKLWITLQTHQNTLAVAKLKELAGIILVNDREPDKETRQKAQEEGIPLLQTTDSAFVISGKLFPLLGRMRKNKDVESLKADLHIHTCLSPCAELSMSPPAIAEQAKNMEIDILGICDHNTAENIPAVIQAASRHRSGSSGNGSHIPGRNPHPGFVR